MSSNDSSAGGVVAVIGTMGFVYWFATIIAYAVIAMYVGLIVLIVCVVVGAVCLVGCILVWWSEATPEQRRDSLVVFSMAVVVAALFYTSVHASVQEEIIRWKAANPGYSDSRLPEEFLWAGFLLTAGIGSVLLGGFLVAFAERPTRFVAVPCFAVFMLFWAVGATVHIPS